MPDLSAAVVVEPLAVTNEASLQHAWKLGRPPRSPLVASGDAQVRRAARSDRAATVGADSLMRAQSACRMTAPVRHPHPGDCSAASPPGVYRLRKVQAAATFSDRSRAQGDFLVIVRCRGELRARSSHQIVAPNVPQLRLVWQAPAGSPVKQAIPSSASIPSSARQQLQEKGSRAEAGAGHAGPGGRQRAHHRRAGQERPRGRALRRGEGAPGSFQAGDRQPDPGRREPHRPRTRRAETKVQEATVALHATSDKAKIASLTRLRDQAKADVDLTRTSIWRRWR